jgi:acetyl esterase/lipase
MHADPWWAVMGVVTWALFTLALVGAASSAAAVRPVRREPFTVASFVLGWPAAEAPVQLWAVEVVGTAALSAAGALGAWPGWVGLALTVTSWPGLAVQLVAARRTAEVVSSALDAVAGDLAIPAGFDPLPRWNTLWHVALAVPLRLRAIRRVRNVDYWGDGTTRHSLDVVRRRDGPPAGGPVLVYVHGGAWVVGDKREQGIPLLHELAARGWVCVAVNYRLSPRATWPDHVVDCKRAVAWVREHIADYGGDPSFVAIAGGSAGGQLCSLVALTPGEPAWQPGFEDADTSVDACVAFYGVYDMTADPELAGAYGPGLRELLERRVFKASLDDDRQRFEDASPLCRVTEAAPPHFVLHGTHDTLVPVVVARRYVDRLRERSRAPVAYAELPYAQHAFDVLASVRCRHAVAGVVRFLESVRAGQAGAPRGHDRREAGSPVDDPTAGPRATPTSEGGLGAPAVSDVESHS